MSNKYYSIGLVTPIDDILAALQDKYGSGNVTVRYQAAEYLIFECASISDKTIKIKSNDKLKYTLSYGDAWTSGINITNEVGFAGQDTGATTVFHLVLGDNLFFANILAPTINSIVAVIGKLSNNDFICMGLCGSTAYKSDSKGRNTTDGTDLTPVVLSAGFVNASGKIYKQNIIFRLNSGAAEENTDGSLATISGLYNISHSLTNTTLLKGANYLMSSAGLNMAVDTSIYLPTCLFAEY